MPPQSKSAPIPLAAGLPPIDYLEKLEALEKGSIKRILDQLEKVAEHDRAMEHRTLWINAVSRFVGQAFGLLACLAAFGTAGFAATHQAEWIGSVVGGTTVVGIVAVFVSGRVIDRKWTPPSS
jgi:uncharacterized membrane protein